LYFEEQRASEHEKPTWFVLFTNFYLYQEHPSVVVLCYVSLFAIQPHQQPHRPYDASIGKVVLVVIRLPFLRAPFATS
jgi:hypothetical protein